MYNTGMPPLSKEVKAWVVNYTPLVERKLFQEKQLTSHGIVHEFINDHDRESLTKEELSRFNRSKLTTGSISCMLKHMTILRHITHSSHNFNLLLEDDAIFEKNFSKVFPLALKELPPNYDMLFLGTCWNLHIPAEDQNPGQLLYKKGVEPTGWGGNGATRCVDSVIISKRAAREIRDYYLNEPKGSISLPIDWWLNEAIRNLALDKIYWIEPTIVSQGSNPGKANKEERYNGKSVFRGSQL